MRDLGLAPAERRRRRSFWSGAFPRGFLMWSAAGGGEWHEVQLPRDRHLDGGGPVEPVLLRLSAEGRLASADPCAFLREDGLEWLYWALS